MVVDDLYMVTPIKTLTLVPPKAPNLLIAPVDYTQTYQDQFSNALRLYFNELDNYFRSTSSAAGGSYVQFPYGAFHYDKSTALTGNITNVSTTPIPVTSTTGYSSSGAILVGSEIITYTAITSTTFAGTITRGAYATSNVAHTSGAIVTSVQGTTAATATPIYLNTVDFSNGVTIDTGSLTSKITFQYPGIYNIQFSAQLSNASSSVIDNVTIWFRQNGIDLPETAGISTVPSSHGGVDGAIISAWNLFTTVNTGDYIELYWTTDSGNSVLKTYPVGTSPTHPVSPAVIVTAQFVSAKY